MVPISQGAGIWMGRQVSLKPLSLGAGRATAADLGTIAVEDDDVPRPQVVGIIAFAVAGAVGFQRGSRRPKVAEIAYGSPGNIILMIASGGVGTGLLTTPGGIIAIVELVQRAIGVDVIPYSVHGRWDIIQQIRRRVILSPATAGDIPRADEHWVTGWSQCWLRPKGGGPR